MILKFSSWNVHSLNNKVPDIMEHIVDRESDIVFLTETWLQFDKNSVTAGIKTYGYECMTGGRIVRRMEEVVWELW